MRTILLADNQDITRTGLLFICQQVPHIRQIEEIKNKRALLQKLTVFPHAVIILDYSLFDLVSIEDLIIIQERFPETDWILFSETLSEVFIRRIILNKKNSIILKESGLEEIENGIFLSLKSEQFICQQVKNLLENGSCPTKAVSQSSPLTNTEKEILKLIASGKSNKEIAEERFSSVHTISTHRKNIFRKLDVNNAYEATKYALRAGIIDEAEYYI
ncbi:MAG: response regulator transcription factor [Candidatus Azobacteroides sp.]|nr:response regulator transcription factor [Candidatus Azobacteroides sp.]